jgi:hypothetical protein
MILAALVLLLSASDEFADFSQWTAGIRGFPEASIESIDGDSCLVLRATSAEPSPSVDDLVRSFPRPVLLSERPFAVAEIWLPPFAEWPINDARYCGFRLTITDQYPRFVWPGIFVARDAGVPCFTVRILADYFGRPITATGWWTLGLGIDGEGALSFYAREGKAGLSEADRFFTDETGWTFAQSFDGWFLQVATAEPWAFGSVQMFADIVPVLDIARDGGAVSLSVKGFASEPYAVERSDNLFTWFPLGVISDAAPLVDAIQQPQQFYRANEQWKKHFSN